MEVRPPRQALRPLQVQADAPVLVCVDEVAKQEKEPTIAVDKRMSMEHQDKGGNSSTKSTPAKKSTRKSVLSTPVSALQSILEEEEEDCKIDNNHADLTTDSAGNHNDTILLMDHFLVMADEQDAEAKQLFAQSSNTAAIPESPKVSQSSPLSNTSFTTCVTPPKSTHKTPLTTMTRPPSALSSKRVIDLQKKKSFSTPSPLKPKAAATTTLNRTSFSASRISSSGQNGKSSPPLLASMKRRKSYIDVKARVDSNLNGKTPAGVGVVALGLASKVADYDSTAPPSQFQRVIGAAVVTPKPGPSSGIKKKPFVVGRATGIPRLSLPFLNSKVPAPNVGRPMPKSASRICPTSNMPAGSVKIGGGTPSRTFKEVNLMAASKLKTPNDVSFHENSRLKTHTGLRHSGNRDESGNASIIQNVSVNKAFLGSRLTTPKSFANKKN